MATIQVGKELIPGHGPWPEVTEFNWYDAGAELILRFRRPSLAEIADVGEGECEFALAGELQALFFLYRFGRAVAWSDAPYSWHLVPPGRRTLPPLVWTGETRIVLQVILVDAGTGIVRGLRALSLGADFSRVLALAIHAQAKAEWKGPAAWDRALARVYRKYPTTEALLETALARTAGGA